MFAHDEQWTAASEQNAAERISETVMEFSPNLIDEGIKANREPSMSRFPHWHRWWTSWSNQLG